MFVLQELNNVKFIEFITRNRPYDFKTDIGHIKTTLGSESKLLQTDTEEDVLNFMLNNLGYEFQIPNSKIKFICSDYFEKWLNQIKDQNKNVPNIGFDTTDILIAILAFTGTGISWIIWGLRKPPLNKELGVLVGTIHVFIFILFAASLCFSWGLAAQIILGILFSLYEICTIIATIRNVFEHRESSRNSVRHWHDYIEQRIPNMRKYLDKIKLKSEQDKNNESDKRNDEMKDEADNQNNNFPDSEKIIDKNKKDKQ